MEITCGQCGGKRPAEEWILPDNCYQCPLCGVIIRRVSGPSTVVDVNGHTLILPGDITLEVLENGRI